MIVEPLLYIGTTSAKKGTYFYVLNVELEHSELCLWAGLEADRRWVLGKKN